MTEKADVKKKSTKNLVIFLCILAVFVFFAMNLGDKKKTSSMVETSIPPTATETSIPLTPTQTKIPQLIPDIWQADVTENLKSRFGMECSELEKGEIYYSRICTKEAGDSRVDTVIYGREVVEVDFISTSYTNPKGTNSETAVEILGFIATIPFVDNDALQTQALDWVKEKLPAVNGGSEYVEEATDINNVHFFIRGKNGLITLEIGELR